MHMKSLAIVAVLMAFSAAGGWAESAVEYNNLGIEAYNGNRYDEAINWFERALSLSPENGTVRRNLCNARQGAADSLAKAGDFDAASRHLERAIQADPENPSPLVQLGAYYLRLDMVPEAVRRLEEAIELKPGYLDAHELLGEAYYRDNDIPWARQQWDYVLKMDPNRPGLKDRYEKAFREQAVEEGFKKSDSSHFKLSAPQDLAYSVRNRVLRMLEEAYREIGRKFGGIYPPGPIQVILYGAEQFTEATQLDDHVGAVYDGKIRAPVTDKSGEWLPDDELKRRLSHEFVHVVVRFLGGANVPWWLNEGLAEAFSSELTPGELDLFRAAGAQGGLYALRQLEPSQLGALSPDALRLAYVQSHATVDFLWNKFGQRRLRELLSDLTAGVAPEDALRNNYRRTYETLQAEVAEGLR